MGIWYRYEWKVDENSRERVILAYAKAWPQVDENSRERFILALLKACPQNYRVYLVPARKQLAAGHDLQRVPAAAGKCLEKNPEREETVINVIPVLHHWKIHLAYLYLVRKLFAEDSNPVRELLASSLGLG